MFDVPPNIRPGMSATANIITEVRENALAIPIQSLTVREYGSENILFGEDNSKKWDEDEEGGEPDNNSKKKELEELVFIVADKQGGVQRDGEVSEIKNLKEKKFKRGSQFAHIRPVKVGISSETHYELLNGLEENDLIVIGNYKAVSKELKHNMQVSTEKDDKE
jgi:HlyD family secretion protein